MKEGQIVYIQGRYKAKIISLHSNDDGATCLVYEGLPPGEKGPKEYSYAAWLLEETKRNLSIHPSPLES